MSATLSPQLGLKDAPLIALVGFLSYVIHELAHGLCGKLLGYDMFVSINKAGLASGEYAQVWHAQLVGAAGPTATIAIGLLGFYAGSGWHLVQVQPAEIASGLVC